MPDNFKKIYSEEEIATCVSRMAGEIRTWVKFTHEQDGEQVLAICVLRGGVFFFADLLKAIPWTLEPSFCRATSYSSTNNAQGATVRLVVEPPQVKNRRVLLVDDICDSGKTLRHLHSYALEHGSKEVRTAVLIHRNREDSVYTPDYCGFEYHGCEWFAGYGMEDKNHNSNFPDVYIVKDDSSPPPAKQAGRCSGSGC